MLQLFHYSNCSDGTNSTDQIITVTVNNLNDNNPVFTSAATFDADENRTAVDTITATDADGDTVAFSITGGADQTTSIDAYWRLNFQLQLQITRHKLATLLW